MLRILLSKLEAARKNPTSFAHTLIDQPSGGRASQGFVGNWKSIVRKHHETDEDFKITLEKLDNKLQIAFKDTPQNKSRRTKFTDSFKSYVDAFSELDLSIDKFQMNLNWSLIPRTLLTGISPFLCSNDDHNIAYFFQEHTNNWQAQIRFPLLQIHLAQQFYKCDVSNVKIGIYNITDKRFDLKTYEDFELDNALEEGKSIFKKVNDVYSNFKK